MAELSGGVDFLIYRTARSAQTQTMTRLYRSPLSKSILRLTTFLWVNLGGAQVYQNS